MLLLRRKEGDKSPPALPGRAEQQHPSSWLFLPGPSARNTAKVRDPPQITQPAPPGWRYFLKAMNFHTHPHHKQSSSSPPAQITEPQKVKPAKSTHEVYNSTTFYPLREPNLSPSGQITLIPLYADCVLSITLITSQANHSHHYTGFFLQVSFLLLFHP